MTMESGPADSGLLATEPGAAQPLRSDGTNIFRGPNGLRAGWRLLIFILLFVAMAATLRFTVHHIPAVQAWNKSQPKNTFTPTLLLLGEGLSSLFLILSALVMTKIEKKSFADYALPLSHAFGSVFGRECRLDWSCCRC
jgi:hypothetical protein